MAVNKAMSRMESQSTNNTCFLSDMVRKVQTDWSNEQVRTTLLHLYICVCTRVSAATGVQTDWRGLPPPSVAGLWVVLISWMPFHEKAVQRIRVGDITGKAVNCNLPKKQRYLVLIALERFRRASSFTFTLIDKPENLDVRGCLHPPVMDEHQLPMWCVTLLIIFIIVIHSPQI